MESQPPAQGRKPNRRHRQHGQRCRRSQHFRQPSGRKHGRRTNRIAVATRDRDPICVCRTGLQSCQQQRLGFRGGPCRPREHSPILRARTFISTQFKPIYRRLSIRIYISLAWSSRQRERYFLAAIPLPKNPSGRCTTTSFTAFTHGGSYTSRLRAMPGGFSVCLISTSGSARSSAHTGDHPPW
jgi:hypothetical protein